MEKITQWSAGFGHAVLLLSDGERIEIHNATSQLWRMEWHTPMFDHIVWTCPCRPCNMDIPPRPGEVLVARFGWVISRSVADMDRVHAWLVFAQRRIWDLRHGS